jgi:membrane-anchored protein YejM (alkaline phosphatase superfamily)
VFPLSSSPAALLFARLRGNTAWASRFWLSNAALFALLGLAYWPWLSVPVNMPIAGLYLLTAHLGWFGLFAMLAGLAHALLAWLPYRWFRWSGLLLGTALATLLMVDALVFGQYRFHLNGFVIDLFLRGGDAISLSWVSWLTGLLLVAVLLFVQWNLGRLAARGQARTALARPARHRRGYLLILACLLASQALHAVEDAHHRPLIPGYSHVFPLYQPLTAKRRLHALGIGAPYSTPDTRVSPRMSSPLRYPLRPVRIATTVPRPNLLLIVIDSWRHDEVNARVTPRIAGFARDAQRHHDHISGGNSTEAGVFSLFYGLPATYWPMIRGGGIPPVLVRAFSEDGYDFSIQSSASLSHPPFDRTVFSPVPRLPPRPEGRTPAQRDRRATERFLDFLRTRNPERPFFGFLFYDAVHGYSLPAGGATPFRPYWQRVDHIRLNNRTDATGYRNRYRNALHHVDAQIGEVLDALRANGLDRNTIVVVTADHGEEFNDNGRNYWGHGSNFSDAQIKVPLFVRWPGQPGRDVSHRTSHFDVAPTLMARVLGSRSTFRDYSIGGDLLDASFDRQALIIGSYYNHAVVSPGEINVVQPGGYVRTLAPDLAPRPARGLRGARLAGVLEQMSRFHGAPAGRALEQGSLGRDSAAPTAATRPEPSRLATGARGARLVSPSWGGSSAGRARRSQ